MGMAAYFVSVTPSEVQHFADHPDELPGFLYQEREDTTPLSATDIDKAWHGLHYLLTGTAYGGALPLADAILGGEEFGEEMDYGPARLLAAPKVAAIAEALAALGPEQLKARYNPQDMDAKQIYPAIWEGDGDTGFDYLLDYFYTLQAYFAGVAGQGKAVITWIG